MIRNFRICGNAPPDAKYKYTRTVNIGVVALDIERAIDLAKKHTPGLEVMSIGQSYGVEIIDPDLLKLESDWTAKDAAGAHDGGGAA